MRLAVDDSATDANDDDEALEAMVDSSFAQQADLYAQQVRLAICPWRSHGAHCCVEQHLHRHDRRLAAQGTPGCLLHALYCNGLLCRPCALPCASTHDDVLRLRVGKLLIGQRLWCRPVA